MTDARCYSATDFFAAGWADHEIGPILGVDDRTGAGGANVWTHQLLMQLVGDRASEPGSPYAPLPKGANMRVAIRRGLRVGALSGTPVEDLGVAPTVQHAMTKADILSGNVDLLEKAGEILAGLPARRLDVTAAFTRVGLRVEITAGRAGSGRRVRGRTPDRHRGRDGGADRADRAQGLGRCRGAGQGLPRRGAGGRPPGVVA